MNADFLGAVARRMVNQFKNDSGLNVRNRVLTASCLFQLAHLSQKLSAETTNEWLRAVQGKIKGFSQIRLVEVCREFVKNERPAFDALETGRTEAIYDALTRLTDKNDPYRNILRFILLVIAEDFSDHEPNGSKIESAAVKALSDDELLEFIDLRTDFGRLMDAELGEIAYTRLSQNGDPEMIVEVM